MPSWRGRAGLAHSLAAGSCSCLPGKTRLYSTDALKKCSLNSDDSKVFTQVVHSIVFTQKPGLGRSLAAGLCSCLLGERRFNSNP